MKKFLFFAFLFLFAPPIFSSAEAQVVRSNCVVTEIGNPATQPSMPSHCTLGEGITYPSNMVCGGGPDGNYCQIQPDPSYKLGSCQNRRWGSKELIGVLYTISTRFKQLYPEGHVYIMDLTGRPKSHLWGIAVDINATTNGKDCVADMRHRSGSICTAGPYNRAATIELGKMIVDTGLFYTIWYNDTVANDAIFAYAKSKFPDKFISNSDGNPGIRTLPQHYHHFHLNIDRARLAYWRNSC